MGWEYKKIARLFAINDGEFFAKQCDTVFRETEKFTINHQFINKLWQGLEFFVKKSYACKKNKLDMGCFRIKIIHWHLKTSSKEFCKDVKID